MQQYLDLKAENPGAVLFFRLGDFYELFFGDARIVAKELNLVLTSRGTDERGCDIPMCGMPWHAAENYVGRLVSAGISVALAEQLETPEEAKTRGHKQIERKVTRVITPGTLTDDNLLSPKKSNFLVAVTSGGPGFLLAGCDISTGEFFVGESENIFDDMTRLGPAEIIYPEALAETTEIIRIRESFATMPIYEKLYTREDINDVVKRFFKNNDLTNDAVKLLAAYLQTTQRGTDIAFRTPYKFGAGEQLLIDSSTWKSLEIDCALNDGGACLLDIIDMTKTAAGARKLRSYLRNLSGDIGILRRRQEHIGHLIINKDTRFLLGNALDNIPDINRALSRLLAGRGAPRDMRAVADFMLALPDLKAIGTKLDIEMADSFEEMHTFDEFACDLKFALNDDLPAFFRDCGVIRNGYSDVLDNMRNMSFGAKETIAKLQAEYAEKTGVSTLKIKYNNLLGYHIEVTANKSDPLMRPESGFIHRQTMSGNLRFTTTRLIELDNEVRGASEKAAAIEADIISNLVEKIRSVSIELMKTGDLLADTDTWYSLAECASQYEWVRPRLEKTTEFHVIGGRHPVIESVLNKSGNQFVSNDCNLSSPYDKKVIALLTGPNMAGKSTYLRQNALIVVLAHLGSFVPARAATIGICDQLFSRVGASDNLAAGQSTFMVEMQETANILNRATNRSFIIFDEIGRGTATWDGMAIAQAVLEFLDNLKPRTLFATHYHELTELVEQNRLKWVKNLTVSVTEHNNEIIFLHKIVEGAAQSSYGIHVAKMAGMPQSVVKAAQRILAGLEGKEEQLDAYEAPLRPTEPKQKPIPTMLIVKRPEPKEQMSLF